MSGTFILFEDWLTGLSRLGGAVADMLEEEDHGNAEYESRTEQSIVEATMGQHVEYGTSRARTIATGFFSTKTFSPHERIV